MPASEQRAAPGRSSAVQHIKPSHFWSSSYVPPNHYWNHGLSHSLLDMERLSIRDDFAPHQYSSLPYPSKASHPDAHPARTLERASKSASLKRLCGKGVTRMGSYLETLHRSAKLVGITEAAGDGDGEGVGRVATPAERNMVARLAGHQPPARSAVSHLFAAAELEEAARPSARPRSREDPGSVGASSEGSDNLSGGPSPAPSSHIYIDMPPRCRKTSSWNCASASDPDDEDDTMGDTRRCRKNKSSGAASTPCACRTGSTPQPDPWDHRAIEYVMVPKAQYMSLYRANRLLRDACCCQGLGKASKLCDNCRQPTVILRSPSPAVSLPASRALELRTPTGSLQTRSRAAVTPADVPNRAQTLLPRLKKGKTLEQKTSPPRIARFSSQELLFDVSAQARKSDPSSQSRGVRPPITVGAESRGSVSGGSRGGAPGGTIRRSAMRLDYTDSWRSLSHVTGSGSSASDGSR